LPTKYGSQPKQEILRQGVESLARVSPEPFTDITQSERAGKDDKVHTHGAIASESVPQPAAERDKDGRPAAAPDANESESTVAVPRGPQSPQPNLEAQREQALRLHAKGMEQIARGNVSGARMFFALAAKAGSTRSMRALARTYDPVQLGKLRVLGMEPDIEAAQKWYQKTEREAPVKAEQSKTNVIVEGRVGADQQSAVNKGEEERRANKLNQRGKQLLAEGDVTAARSFFRAAAEAGDAEAALAMGGTYAGRQ
jgi:TPR repeat protein